MNLSLRHCRTAHGALPVKEAHRANVVGIAPVDHTIQLKMFGGPEFDVRFGSMPLEA